MLIRSASEGDIEIIQELILQLGYDVEASYLSERMKSPNTSVYVACEGEKVVGMIGGVTFDYFHKPTCIARLESLVIDMNFRRKGIGKELIKYFEQEAKQNKCTMIELSSGLKRIKDGTYDFYESEGYLNQTDCETTYFRKYL